MRQAFKSAGLLPFDPDLVLDKIRDKQAQAETAFRTPSSPLRLHPRTPQGPASAYAKLNPGEKVDSKQIQRFIRGLIASAYTYIHWS